MVIWRAIWNNWSLLHRRSQSATEGCDLRFFYYKVSSVTSQAFLCLFNTCKKHTQHHNPPGKKGKKKTGSAGDFFRIWHSPSVSVELIPSLVLGKLSCWKDKLSYKKYNQNLDRLLFRDYLIILEKKKRILILWSWPTCILPHQKLQ